jgi:hypothetical protein
MKCLGFLLPYFNKISNTVIEAYPDMTVEEASKLLAGIHLSCLTTAKERFANYGPKEPQVRRA